MLAVIEETARDHRVSAAEIMSGARYRIVAYARHDAAYRLRHMDWRGGVPSLPEIGRWLGVDHTTVLFAVRAHRKRWMRQFGQCAAIYQGRAL